MPLHRLVITTIATIASLALVGCEPTETSSRNSSRDSSRDSSSTKSRATVKITASKGVCWTGKVGREAKSGCGRATVQIRDSKGTYRIQLRKTKGSGQLAVVLIVDDKTVDRGEITGSSGVVAISYADR